ncbi:MAG TPA: DUF2207 domain-containing protein [Caldilineae bacterium]|nr:DUF2207 domain-containing protein [Caldilineae bacterium]
MRRNVLRWMGLVAVLLLLATGLTQAQSKTLYWDRWDVDITVFMDGTFRVVERQTIEFTSGVFTFGIRGIDTRRLERISDIKVMEGDQVFREDASRQPWTFTTYMEGNELKIKWFFPPTSDSRHTYTIAYTVHGGLRYYPEGDQIWWKAVVADRAFPVYNSRVLVQIPEQAEIQNWDAYGVSATAQKLDEHTVVFEATEKIPPGREFEVRIQFTPGVVAGEPQPWQAEADAEAAALERQAEWDRRWRPVANIFMISLGLLLLLGGPVLLYLLWYLRGRDAPVKLPADYLIDPPSDLPPGVAGTLLDERADMEDIIATIVDLARRGVIIIEEVHEPGMLGIGSRTDFIYRLVGSTEGLRPFEETLINAIFGRRKERRLSELKNRFYRKIPGIQRQLYEEVVKAGYFKASPERTRGIYVGLGIAGLILTGVLGVCSLAALSTYTDFAYCPSVGLGAIFIGLIVLARAMPRKTPEGSEAAARWRAFRRYLENIEKYTNLEEAKEIFERYLPYAIAFGVEKEYVRKFAAVGAPAPSWYMPYPTGRPYIRPGHASGGGRAPGHASGAPASEGEGGMPSLEGMTTQTFGGLEAMTDGLFTMLNSASSTFSSRPSSSGSRGGFGGGGWSGGSSSGGGGSGGGSAGFG